MTLGLYVLRRYALRFLALLLALAGLLQLIDVMDRADEIVGRGLGAEGMARYALLRLPLVAAPAIPLAALAGAVLVFAGLSGRNELAAMRAAGVSLTAVTAAMLPVGLAAAALHFVLADLVSGPAERAFRAWWGMEEKGPLWFLDGRDAVGISVVADQGRHLAGIEIFVRDAQGRLLGVMTASEAEVGEGRWTLLDGALQPVGHPREPFGRRPWTTSVGADNLAEMADPGPAVSSGRARAVLAGERAGQAGPAYWRTHLHRGRAQPLASPVMILLATPAARAAGRRTGLAVAMAAGLAAGLSFLVFAGILASMGEAGTLPAAMAAWVPPAMFALLGIAMLIHAEGWSA